MNFLSKSEKLNNVLIKKFVECSLLFKILNLNITTRKISKSDLNPPGKDVVMVKFKEISLVIKIFMELKNIKKKDFILLLIKDLCVVVNG